MDVFFNPWHAELCSKAGTQRSMILLNEAEACSDRKKMFIKMKTARLALQIYHVVDLLDREWQ